MNGVLDMLDRPRYYYRWTVLSLSATATAAGALGIVADGGATVEAVMAGGASSGLLALTVSGVIAFWAREAWRIEKLKLVTANAPERYPNMTHEQPRPVIKYVEARQYAADTADYQPNFVMLPNERGNAGGMLHVTPDQLTIIKRRIRQNNLSLPINGLDGFTSVQAKALRAEVVRLELAEQHGQNNQMVRWSGEGAVRVLRASPAGLVPARK